MKKLVIVLVVIAGAFWLWNHRPEPGCGWDREWQHYTQCIPGTNKPFKTPVTKGEVDTKAEVNKKCDPVGSPGEGTCTLPNGITYHYCDYDTNTSCIND